jgi:hypothetical protein
MGVQTPLPFEKNGCPPRRNHQQEGLALSMDSRSLLAISEPHLNGFGHRFRPVDRKADSLAAGRRPESGLVAC